MGLEAMGSAVIASPAGGMAGEAAGTAGVDAHRMEWGGLTAFVGALRARRTEAIVVLTAVTAATVVYWLRRTRRLGLSISVRCELMLSPPAQFPDEPSSEWLGEVRAVMACRPIYTRMERLLGRRPPWAQQSAVIVFEDKIKSSHDGELIPVRVFLPRMMETNEQGPICVFFHGGGFVFCGDGSHDHIGRYLAARGTVTVMVDYRLAPEHKYPVPLLDCLDALRWASRSASELGCDPSRLVVAGDSAGGNLALGACLKARDTDYEGFAEGARGPAGMLLVYPSTSRQLISLPGGSYEKFAQGHGLTRQHAEWMWRMYTGVPTSVDLEPEPCRYATPLDARAPLYLLPPTHILLADHDILYDDGAQLVGRLRAAGVHCTVDEVRNTLHGYFHHRARDPHAWELFLHKAATWVAHATAVAAEN